MTLRAYLSAAVAVACYLVGWWQGRGELGFWVAIGIVGVGCVGVLLMGAREE